MYHILHSLRTLKENFSSDTYEVKDGSSYLNFYSGYWFGEFLEHNYPKKKTYNVLFTSVNGKRTSLSKYVERKVFFSGENVEPYIKHEMCFEEKDKSLHWWFLRKQKLYHDYRISEVELALGYGFHSEENYLRFPLWMMHLFSPRSTYADIKNIVKNINNACSTMERSAVCLNKHDVFGLRRRICDECKNILDITYAGKWRHNSDELWNNYDNDKLRYLKLFKFNICPENMDARGYCTEKLFDTFRCGCIPIYAGCEDNPEPDCVNKDAIIQWNLDDDNSYNLKLINRLEMNDRYYQKFIQQEKLKPYTAEYVMDTFSELRKRLGELL